MSPSDNKNLLFQNEEDIRSTFGRRGDENGPEKRKRSCCNGTISFGTFGRHKNVIRNLNCHSECDIFV